MRRTMNVLTLFIISAVVLVAFMCYSKTLTDTLTDLNIQHDQCKSKLADLENEKTDLNERLSMVGTDAFIENQARTMYGYMMEDEIRFVITNPEALYGDQQIPPR